MPFCQLNLCARLSFLNCAAAAAGPGFGSWVLTRGWPWPQWYQKSISTPTACSFLIKFYKKPKCETSVKTNWVWLNLVKMRSRRSTPLSTGQFNPIQAKLNRDSPQNESINDTQLATMTAAKKVTSGTGTGTSMHTLLPAGWHHRRRQRRRQLLGIQIKNCEPNFGRRQAILKAEAVAPLHQHDKAPNNGSSREPALGVGIGIGIGIESQEPRARARQTNKPTNKQTNKPKIVVQVAMLMLRRSMAAWGAING